MAEQNDHESSDDSSDDNNNRDPGYLQMADQQIKLVFISIYKYEIYILQTSN